MIGTSVMKELMSQKQILEEPLAPLLIGETFEKLNLQEKHEVDTISTIKNVYGHTS